ncbi:phage capsid protein [Mameliella alba]|uniref:Major capsid protein n=1 Tax=Mameliella alba TaxID=561184 RepID=A0A0B3S0Y9_9RHOB|nr:phage capsid protein [Mameliella alba]KHQ50281.1 hypothetical protein OA50_05129 [Mameliella alba]
MSYNQTVEPHHRLQYSNNVRMVAQEMQISNKLRAAVTIVPASGEAQDIADLIGKTEYQEGEDYGQRNPEITPSRDRRWLIRPRPVEIGQTITKEEKFDQAMDPTSMLVRNQVVTVERGVYDRILGVKKVGSSYEIAGGGILGAVHSGKTPSSTSDLPTGNFIAVNAGGAGNTGLTSFKLRAATEAMELEDFGLETEDEVWGLITPKQKTDLINLALATSSNLNPFDVNEIREGRPGKLLGINWMFSNRLPVDSDGYRLIPIWTKANVVCGMWQDVEGAMWNNTERKNLPYIFTDAYPAAGRIEDGGVRVIRCNEA